MQITEARLNDGYLILSAPVYEAVQFLKTFKSGEYDIKPHREKRSLNANSYAWQLINRIASALHRNPIDIYREAIMDCGQKTELIQVVSGGAEDFLKAFTAGHIGRTAEIISISDGWTMMQVFYGSSDYDRKQMSVLIDHLTQDCKALGVPTLEDEKMRSLLEEWDAI